MTIAITITITIMMVLKCADVWLPQDSSLTKAHGTTPRSILPKEVGGQSGPLFVTDQF
jgi:hypothetical protein